LRDAGTLKDDPLTGYAYNSAAKWWSYSNYPNYKDFNADGKYKVAVVCKTGGSWFETKRKGMQDACDKYGYELNYFDADFDEQAWMDAIDNAINQDFDAVIMTPPSYTLLPEAIDKLQKAGIAYMTGDDPGPDTNGFYAPHWGLWDWYLAN